MQNFKSDTIPHGCVFVSNHPIKQSITNWDSTVSDETAYSPYMLDAINDIDRLLLVNGKRRGVSSTKKIEAKYWIDMPFNDVQLPEERGDARMVRVSDCKYLVATVFTSSIIIEKSETVLEQRPLDESSIEAEFQITEGKYTYLEWPPLNHNYIEKPYFLTLDDQGKIRIHYVKEKTEETVTKEEEFYRCATFSWDGRYIYAINDKQEICKINFESSRIMVRRKLEGLSSSEEMISTHIQQVTPLAFAIGSVEKIKIENEVIEGDNTDEDEENKAIKINKPEKAKFKSYLRLVSGDVSDTERELKIKTFEIPLLPSDPNKVIIFRSLYIKERGLLLFGHSNSPKVLALSFGFDGSITENAGINLLFTPIRGIVFMSEERPASDQKNENVVDYHKKKFKLPKPPKILILDAKGLIHVYHYYDTRYVAPKLSMYIRPLSIQEFGQKQNTLKEKLNPKHKNRSKSQENRIGVKGNSLQEKHRSKSHVKRKDTHPENETTSGKKQTKIDLEQKKTPIIERSPLQEIQVNKVEYPFASRGKTEGIAMSSLISPTPLTLSNEKENPFLSVKREEIKSITQKTSQTTNSLFSSSRDSLFSQNTKPSFLFQKPIPKKTREESEAKENLFSSKPKFNFSSQASDLGGSRNLFSSNACLKLFTTKEDLDNKNNKNASLFLEKASSDVHFKVENQEFSAHKSVLSEKCKFFKQMFASGMLESYSSVIIIPDTKASMFRAFLEYVYLGQTVLNEEICLTLIDLAEKYIIEDLKVACENCLSLNLTVDNFPRFYEAAELYDAPYLKQKTMLFIEMSLKKVLEKYNLQDLPLSGLSVLANYYKNNPIVGPSISQLIVKTEDPLYLWRR